MSATTKIEWAEKTWNPVRGCSVVSPGCVNCYAMKQAHRFSAPGKAYAGLTKQTKAGPQWTGVVRTVESALLEPLSWRKPARIFVNSMSDLFHEDVPWLFIDRVFATMAMAPQHTFQILTKRPEVMRDYLSRPGKAADIAVEVFKRGRTLRESGREARKRLKVWPLPNVWLGVSTENQQTANERIPLLLQTPAAVRFVSAEPLLGPIDLTNLETNGFSIDALRGEWCSDKTGCLVDKGDAAIGWIIAGGESGPGARPMHPHWPAIIRNQCRAAGVPFFFKQWGEWQEGSLFRPGKPPVGEIVLNNGHHARLPEDFTQDERNSWPSLGASMMAKVGKKAAGRELDGREWNEFPRDLGDSG